MPAVRSKPIHRSLPTWAVDAIHSGASRRDTSERGDRAVWDRLGSTALSAVNCGWTRTEWQDLVTGPQQQLGLQVSLTSKGRPRLPAQIQRVLDRAWDRASAKAAESPAWTKDEIAAEISTRVAVLRKALLDPTSPFTDSDRALLLVVVELAEERGSTSVNLPRRTAVERSGLGDRTIRNAFKRLSEGDQPLLLLLERGRSSGDIARRKANVYALPTPAHVEAYLSRETRHVGPPAKSSGTPLAREPGTQPETSGTPCAVENDPKEHNVTTLTLTLDAAEEAKVLDLLNDLRRPNPVTQAHGPVRHLHAVGEDTR